MTRSAVIMAGGNGTRLRPLTCGRPKPMVPFLNRPIMEYSLHLLRQHNLTQAVATLHYLPEAITSYFTSGQDWGINLSYSLEQFPLGTAGGVRQAARNFRETFVVLSGDGITDIDLSQAITFHRRQGALATIVLTRVENPLEYGIVLTDRDGRIKRFLEKPGWGQVFSDTINTGIYILEPQVLEHIPPDRPYDFSQDLFPSLLAAQAPLFGFVAEGYWCDIGNLEQYRQASFDFLQGKIKTLPPGELISPGIWAARGASIDTKARLVPPVVIGEGSSLGPGAWLDSFTILGRDVLVETNASSKRSIIWDRSQLGHRAQVRGSVLANRVRLAERASVFEGAVLADDVVLGRGAVVRPKVKVWPAKFLENEAVLSDHLIWGATQRKTLFGHKEITGRANFDITPELAAKLGAAFGSHMERGSWVVVGSDGEAAAEMLKGALITGLLSTGVHVHDLGKEAVLTPVTRYAVLALQSQGGIHLKAAFRSQGSLSLEFFDHRGLNIPEKMERKLGNALERDDFRRVEPRSAGRVSLQTGMLDAYRQNLLKQIDTLSLKRWPQHLVALFPTALTDLVSALFAELGWTIRYIPYQPDSVAKGKADLPDDLAPFSPPTGDDHTAAPSRRGERARPGTVPPPDPTDGVQSPELSIPAELIQSAREAQQNWGAELAAVIGPSGEELVLLTGTGRIVQGGTYTLLATQLSLHRHPESPIVLPITAPSAAERLVALEKGQVLRTTSSLPNLLDKAWEMGKTARVIGFPPSAKDQATPRDRGLYQRVPFWLYQLDALTGLLMVLEALAQERTSLDRLIASLPTFVQTQLSVVCGPEAKGRVLRQLSEEAGSMVEEESLEGVTFHFEKGRALILPDAIESLCQIYCEASTLEDAADLAQRYARKVQELTQA
ncbi:MAG: sugar phosphate nucleotidyltransferase [Firmicutes bacterium]|nr:sugar phosphate nucleotidyltransferase [Bacillota bacterium]